jgi:hypothetical protein
MRHSKSWHIVAGGIFLVLTVMTLRAFLFGDSLFIYRDVVWPTDTKEFLSIYYTLDLEALRRSIFLAPFFSGIEILGLSSLMAEKLLFILVRFFAGFFAYLAVYKFLSSKIKDSEDKRLVVFLVSLFAGFFYAYNPIATTMVSATIFFAFSYSLIPLIFYYFDRALNERGFHNIFITSTLISLALAGTTQYLVLIPLFLLVPWVIIVCLQRKKMGKEISVTIKNFSFITLLSFFISIYWIIVTISQSYHGIGLLPGYVLTSDTLNLFSNENTLVNIFRLLGDWAPRVSIMPSLIVSQQIWIILSFVIPVTLMIFIIFSRNSKLQFYILSFCLISLLVIFFHKGTQPPITDFYPLLYDLPVIGWMFRIPSKFGMILAFYFTMILALGFYNLLSSKTKITVQYTKYILLAGFIACTSLIVWPMFTGDFGGVYQQSIINSQNTMFPARNITIDISKENVGLFGGLDTVSILNGLDLINMSESSLILADHSMDDFRTDILKATDNIVIDGKSSLMMHLLSNKSIVIEPFDATKRHNPKEVWSKAGSDDPLHGEFHYYLQKRFAINNTDLDYGKGLVFTWAKDKLDIPIDVKETDNYDLYVRYMKNEHGGPMKIYFDKQQISLINTTDQLNKFVWKNIGRFNLTNGEHTLTLENTVGLNAVNIFALIPSTAIPQIKHQVSSISDKTRNIYLLDAKSDFYTLSNKAYDNGSGRDVTASSANSSLWTSIDLLKTSLYGIATKVKVCEQCSTLTIEIGDEVSKEFSLRSNKTEFKWLYFTANLTAGDNTSLKVHSDRKTDLDTIVLFSDSNEVVTLPEVFAQQEYASVLEYNQLNPTKYEVQIDAVREPFILKFTQNYSQLWEAYIDGKKYNPIQVYPGINGFIIDQIGRFNIVIEYASQKWFYLGAILSTMTFAASLGYLMYQHREAILAFVRDKIASIKQDKEEQKFNNYATVVDSKEDNKHIINSQDRPLWQQQDERPLRTIKHRIPDLFSIDNPEFLTMLSLIVLLCIPFLLLMDEEPLANAVMIYFYFLLLIGVSIQYIGRLIITRKQ